jgi:predicted RNase H-like HicB family nuclease
MNTFDQRIVIEETATGFSVFDPDVPGCGATGRTLAQAIDNLREAIRFHHEGLALALAAREEREIAERRQHQVVLWFGDVIALVQTPKLMLSAAAHSPRLVYQGVSLS